MGIILWGPGEPLSYEDNSRQIPPTKSMLTRYPYLQPSGSSGAHFLGGNLTGIILIAPWHPRTPQDDSRQIPLTKSMLTRYPYFQPSGSSGAHFLWGGI